MEIKMIPLGEINPYINNPRKNAAAVEKVAMSIEEFGFKVPVIIDRDGVIVAGHTRVKAAEHLGMNEVPCIIADDLSEEQVKAFRLADNKVAEFAEWDMDLLISELADVRDLYTGFDVAEIEELLNETTAASVEETAAPDPPENPITKRGDIWLMGKHRLMCADCTSEADVRRLMGDVEADACFTDPPYNVDYSGGTSEKLKILNDNMSGDKFYQFLLDAFTNMYNVMKPGAAIYICHADSEGAAFRGAMVASGFLFKQCLVWAKNALVLGRQDYQWQHEPILYGWKQGAAHRWYGGRKQTTLLRSNDCVTVTETSDGGANISISIGLSNITLKVPRYEVVADDASENLSVWQVQKPTKNEEHPTMKPIKLCARGVQNNTLAGDVVIDFFGGSGSTLMACEQLGRICYTMELDERYCDVIKERWEAYTGQAAVLESEL